MWEITPTPWDSYPRTTVKFVELKLDDYRHAVRCVNAHDELKAALGAIATTGMDCAAADHPESFYHAQLAACIGTAARALVCGKQEATP